MLVRPKVSELCLSRRMRIIMGGARIWAVNFTTMNICVAPVLVMSVVGTIPSFERIKDSGF